MCVHVFITQTTAKESVKESERSGKRQVKREAKGKREKLANATNLKTLDDFWDNEAAEVNDWQ